MTNWVKLKFAAMNLKKLAIWKWNATHQGWISANQQDGEEIFFLFLCSFTFHAKNPLWLDCHSRFSTS
ncbi:MAG: hypothetical protein ACLRWF_04405 [Ruthenibacterium sp.]